jgi:ribosomal-protein-alanine N-acetyltransferase
MESNTIRTLKYQTDLDRVADLIERSFPIHQDPDGQTYVQEMRKTAQEMRLLGWMSQWALSDFNVRKTAGFVWEEHGEIIGNLSLIPFKEGGQNVYLIANVAVDPHHRRKGIARALTQRALGYLRRQNEPHVWLQVKDDNHAAIQLYRSLGFEDRDIRTTWRIRPKDRIKTGLKPSQGIKISRLKKNCCEDRQDWLMDAYPKQIRWNLSVDFSKFEPGILNCLVNWLDGVRLKHWAIMSEEQCQGVITWQKTTSFANNLWLAFPQDREEESLPQALQFVLKGCAPNHSLSIDYPAGRLADQFEILGFIKFRTLIWMKYQD